MDFEQVTGNEDGWSNWIQPKHASYLMKCCDCGLVHELQFRVVADTPDELVDADNEIPGLVVFRASRRDDLKEKDMTLENIARVCHEVNRAYCQALGDFSQAPWDEAPEWQRSSARMGVDLHLMGDFGPEASHISWMKQKLEEGWTYGPVKDVEKKEHPCLVPFDELPLEQQIKDHLFRAVVHALRPAKASGLTFGQALDALKAGKKVCRAGWNGSGMFAYYVPANSYPAQTGIAKEHFGDGALVPYRSYLALKTAQGDVATWAPSCSDALAEDWEIVQ